jgi:hypothetical protein
MFTFISHPFPLLPFLHVDLHQIMGQEHLVDPVMRDVNPMCFFDLLFQMDGTQVVSVIGFKNQFFNGFVYGLGSSSWLLEYWRFLDFIECLDNLVDSLSGNLKISSDLCNRLPVQPLLEDPLNIPIG